MKEPTYLDLTIKLLAFLAADGSEQVCEIQNYLKKGESDPSMRAHISEDPIYEIIETIKKLAGVRTEELFSNQVNEVIEELRWTISALLNDLPSNQNLTEENILKNPEWRILRRLARECLRLIGPNEADKISIMTLLCFLGD